MVHGADSKMTQGRTSWAASVFVIVVSSLVFLLFAGTPALAQRAGDITLKRLLHADAEPGEWLRSGRDYEESYYSPLADISRTNVSKLGFAWSCEVDPAFAFPATPIVVDGTMFANGGGSTVYALDAKTGTLRWSFKPHVDGSNHGAGSNRGVAVWEGKVYSVAGDGILYALAAMNGKLLWHADTIVDRSRTYSSPGAPYVAGDLVVIGNGGGEYDVRGYVTAYDAATGREKWRFFVVPGDPAKGFEHPELRIAAKTWDPHSRWDLGGGGTVWDGMAYDPKLDLLYFGTGNGIPWNRALRSPSGGDNLFLTSILAVSTKTGALVWHYQTTPGDNWDYDADQKMILADMPIGGRTRQVIMQANKNGFFYVLDRKTGKLLSARPFIYTNWAKVVDLKTGRPLQTGEADYTKEPKLVFPSSWGGHNWQPMSYDPQTHLVYVPVLHSGSLYGPTGEPLVYRKGQWNIGVTYLDGEQISNQNLPPGWPSLDRLFAGRPDHSPRTFLMAWDPVKQSKAWEVETSVPGNRAASGNPAGVISTAGGLLFQGRVDGSFFVFDAHSGEQLRRIDCGLKMVAAPLTYRVDGEQYIAIMGSRNTSTASSGEAAGPGSIIAFKIGGGKVPYPVSPGDDTQFAPPVPRTGTAEQVALGEKLFAQHCALCHQSATRAPDLAQLNAQGHHDFMDIVLKGARANKGMPNFGSILSSSGAEAIHAFVTDEAWKKYLQSQPAGAQSPHGP
jgi:quinohemoprotein ethanol dehydrogenase